MKVLIASFVSRTIKMALWSVRLTHCRAQWLCDTVHVPCLQCAMKVYEHECKPEANAPCPLAPPDRNIGHTPSRIGPVLHPATCIYHWTFEYITTNVGIAARPPPPAPSRAVACCCSVPTGLGRELLGFGAKPKRCGRPPSDARACGSQTAEACSQKLDSIIS